MNKEYYTPDIEDIRIGYECEITYDKNSIGTNDEYFFKYVVEPQYFNDGNYAALRTPYLTKEQIEAEGYQSIINITGSFATAIDNTEYSKYTTYIKGSYGLNYIPNKYLLRICWFGGVYPVKVFFEGQCKSVNEFRIIIKLITNE